MAFTFILSLIFVLVSWYLVYHFLAFKLKYSLKNKIILVTGCDSGFGNNLAKKLDEIGAIVFATCIGKESADQLNKDTSSNCHIIMMDVTKIDEINAAYTIVKNYCLKNKSPLYGIVNNAGIAESSPFECMSRNTFTKVIEVNTIGLINVTRIFLPLIRMKKYNKYLSSKYGTKLLGFYQRGKAGRIINIASMAGRRTRPYMAPYCVSKWGVVAFTDCIRPELQKFFNIWCTEIEPFFVMTNIVKSALDLERDKNVWHKAEEDYNNVNDEKEMEDGEGIDKLMDVYDITKYLQWKKDANKIVSKVAFFTTDIVVQSIICGLSSYFPLKAYHPSWLSSMLYRLDRYVFPQWFLGAIDDMSFLHGTFTITPIRDSFIRN